MGLPVVAVIVIVSHIALNVQAQQDDCTVTIQNGTIIGATGDTLNPSKKVCSYLGIPFATPPVGQLRFQAPRPTQGWNDPLVATNPPNWCPQLGSPPLGSIVSEYCLYLNVYQPKIENISDVNLPVMVCTGDAVCPGNNGLKDQALSLRWVNENIRAFGGNPGQVTVFGESAGAASAIYQLVSPLNSGLIHRVIAQSYIEVKTRDPNPFDSAQLMARRFGCPEFSTSQEIMDCLSEFSMEEIIQKQMEYVQEGNYNLIYPYATVTPVVEPDLPGAFLTRETMDIIKDGDIDSSIPVMLGSTKHEGSFILGYLYLSAIGPRGLDKDSEYMRNQLVPDLLKHYAIEGDDVSRAVASSLEMTYLAGVNRSSWNESMAGLVDLVSVFHFRSGVYAAAELLSKKGHPVYLYSFEHHSENSVWESLFGFCSSGVPVQHGVTHGDDLIYMFNLPGKFSREDQSFSELFCDMWLNFAREGIGELYLKLNGSPTVQSGYTSSWRPNGFEWD